MRRYELIILKAWLELKAPESFDILTSWIFFFAILRFTFNHKHESHHTSNWIRMLLNLKINIWINQKFNLPSETRGSFFLLYKKKTPFRLASSYGSISTWQRQLWLLYVSFFYKFIVWSFDVHFVVSHSERKLNIFILLNKNNEISLLHVQSEVYNCSVYLIWFEWMNGLISYVITFSFDFKSCRHFSV